MTGTIISVMIHGMERDSGAAQYITAEATLKQKHSEADVNDTQVPAVIALFQTPVGGLEVSLDGSSGGEFALSSSVAASRGVVSETSFPAELEPAAGSVMAAV